MNRQDLKDYKYNEQWIKDRKNYLREYRSTIDNITATISGMPHGSSKVQDKFAEKVAILVDGMSELWDKTIEQFEKQKQILEQIDRVEQPYKIILDKMYIQGKSLEAVAGELNYSYRHIKRQHAIALKKFDEVA